MGKADVTFIWHDDDITIMESQINAVIAEDHLQITGIKNYSINKDRISSSGMTIDADYIQLYSDEGMQYNAMQMKKSSPIKFTLKDNDIVLY